MARYGAVYSVPEWDDIVLCYDILILSWHIRAHSKKPFYSSLMIGTLVVDRWPVTFCTSVTHQYRLLCTKHPPVKVTVPSCRGITALKMVNVQFLS